MSPVVFPSINLVIKILSLCSACCMIMGGCPSQLKVILHSSLCNRQCQQWLPHHDRQPAGPRAHGTSAPQPIVAFATSSLRCSFFFRSQPDYNLESDANEPLCNTSESGSRRAYRNAVPRDSPYDSDAACDRLIGPLLASESFGF